MANSKLQQAAALGQSIWLDQIKRSWLNDGLLRDWIDRGLKGVTSNPSIFKEAIAENEDYIQDLRRMALDGRAVEEIYENLIVEDIKRTADELRRIYDETNGKDGYISLEVNPRFAHDTQKTIEQVRHYWDIVSRPNLLVKIPATAEGLPAIQTLISEGFNINVTLMFSISQYDLVTEAYIAGLEQREQKGMDIDSVFSVASFFVSRVDQKVDPLLDKIDRPEAQEIKGKIGIANAKMAYQRFKEKFDGGRWQDLKNKRAMPQIVLYGSTSTKNPDYPDTYYVDNLMGPMTINTLPLKTIEAFEDHGTVQNALESGLEEAIRHLDTLDALGIDLDTITTQLLDEGVQKFVDPFDALMDYIVEKQTEYLSA